MIQPRKTCGKKIGISPRNMVIQKGYKGIHGDVYIYMYVYYTLLLFNIAMENGPFIDDFPLKPPFISIYEGFSMAMLNNQMVTNKNNLCVCV